MTPLRVAEVTLLLMAIWSPSRNKTEKLAASYPSKRGRIPSARMPLTTRNLAGIQGKLPASVRLKEPVVGPQLGTILTAHPTHWVVHVRC